MGKGSTLFHLSEITQADESTIPTVDDLFKEQQALVIPRRPCAHDRAYSKDGKDPVGCHGADAPLAILSDKPQLLYSYASSKCLRK